MLPIVKPTGDFDRVITGGFFKVDGEKRHLPGQHNQQSHAGGKGGDKNSPVGDRPTVHRGIVVNAEDVPMPVAKRIAAGTATDDDILSLVDTKDTGQFWYSESEGFGKDDAKEFSYGEETVDKGIQNAHDSAEVWKEPLADTVHFELPVILTGKGPKGFDSSKNTAAEGMGNSYLPAQSTVKLTEIEYDNGSGWQTIKTDKVINVGGKPGFDPYGGVIDEGRSERREIPTSTVERAVVRVGDNCKECVSNSDPSKVPVHPGCNCDVVTEAVEVGVDAEEFKPTEHWVRENGKLKFIPGKRPLTSAKEVTTLEGLELNASTVTVLDPADMRFADFLRWFEQVQLMQDVQDEYVAIMAEDVEVFQEFLAGSASEVAADRVVSRVWLALARWSV